MDQELRKAAISSLSSEAGTLLDEIEAFAGTAIRFAPYSFPPRDNSINPVAPATIVSHDQATIYLHGAEPIHLWGLPHELLHIRRYWYEGVPQLHPKADRAGNVVACGNVENTLEHLVIVPQEPAFGMNTSEYWHQVVMAKWKRYPWPDISDPNGRRGNALLGRLEVELARSEEAAQLASDCLKAEGLLSEAEKFAERTLSLISEKARATACAVRFLRWPCDKLHLVYFDIRGRTRRHAPLPSR